MTLSSPVTDCRHFNGYKPCGKSDVCSKSCPHIDRVTGASILIVHLGAQGAVVRSTSLLKAFKQKFPQSRITWVTDAPMQDLLKHHPLIDRVFTSNQLIELSALQFDIAIVIDKSLKASGVLKATKAEAVFGFVADPTTGSIVPANPAGNELWELGLSNEKKFFQNQKTENQLLIEALELGPYRRDEYSVHLNEADEVKVEQRRMQWRKDSSQPIVGLNTGCGPLMPAKKWTVEFHRQVIAHLRTVGLANIVLLGGPEDTERNQQIAEGFQVFSSPTSLGICDGAASVAACDLVVTGDSLGMHLAIAFKKFVVAWFGPSCAQEIDLYDRGVKLHAEVGCSPCWKRSCTEKIMCYDRVPAEKVIAAVRQGIEWWQKSESRTSDLSRPNSLSG